MKTLIAYFSYTGNTRTVARHVESLTGGTLYEITPETTYSADYDTTEMQGRRETAEGTCPPLAGPSPDLALYDTILVATPNWFNTMAPPVATFLSENDFSHKKVAVICTNGGGGLGHVLADVSSLCTDAQVIDQCLGVYENGGERAVPRIAAWLDDNGLR